MVYFILVDMRHVITYKEPYILKTSKCYKPNYHPFDSSLTSIADRRTITEKHKCKKRMKRRFTIVDDKIRLNATLKSGKVAIYIDLGYTICIYKILLDRYSVASLKSELKILYWQVFSIGMAIFGF